MSKLIEFHLKTMAAYPPVQKGTSFDLSNVVEDFIQKLQLQQ